MDLVPRSLSSANLEHRAISAGNNELDGKYDLFFSFLILLNPFQISNSNRSSFSFVRAAFNLSRDGGEAFSGGHDRPFTIVNFGLDAKCHPNIMDLVPRSLSSANLEHRAIGVRI
jgi:hypothetical protein